MTAATVPGNSLPIEVPLWELCNGCRLVPAVWLITVYSHGPGDGEPFPTTTLCDGCARRVIESNRLEVSCVAWSESRNSVTSGSRSTVAEVVPARAS